MIEEKIIPKKTTKPKRVKSVKPKVSKKSKRTSRQERESDEMRSEESSETWRSEDKENQFDVQLVNEKNTEKHVQKRVSAINVMNETTKKRKLDNRRANTNSSSNNNTNSIDNSQEEEERASTFFGEYDADSADAMLSLDRKQIVEEVDRKSRPPTRSTPQTLSSGIPTFYGSGDNRIAWTPNFDHGGKVLFGARFPTKLNHLTSKVCNQYIIVC
jgi:hypothetical protein